MFRSFILCIAIILTYWPHGVHGGRSYPCDRINLRHCTQILVTKFSNFNFRTVYSFVPDLPKDIAIISQRGDFIKFILAKNKRCRTFRLIGGNSNKSAICRIIHSHNGYVSTSFNKSVIYKHTKPYSSCLLYTSDAADE